MIRILSIVILVVIIGCQYKSNATQAHFDKILELAFRDISDDLGDDVMLSAVQSRPAKGVGAIMEIYIDEMTISAGDLYQTMYKVEMDETLKRKLNRMRINPALVWQIVPKENGHMISLWAIHVDSER